MNGCPGPKAVASFYPKAAEKDNTLNMPWLHRPQTWGADTVY